MPGEVITLTELCPSEFRSGALFNMPVGHDV